MSTGTPNSPPAHEPASSRTARRHDAAEKHERHLIADIGGTHARFALCTSARDIEHVDVLDSAAFASMEDAIRHYLGSHGNPRVRHAVIGIANPVLGDHVKMTNAAWEFSIEDMRCSLGLEHLHVLNDFAVLAMAVPHLEADDLMQVGGGNGVAGAPLGLLGPGTGLGVSALVPTRKGGPIALATEGGHASFAPADDLQAMLWRAARKRHGHVSMERLISGSGLAFIYEALCEDQGKRPNQYTPAEISTHAMDGTDTLCRLALDTFCAILGSAAADLALTLGARGGIYIGGGIIKKLGEYFPQSPFRKAFEDKGRFQAYLAAIPVFVILARQPALTGAAAYLETLSQE